MKRILVEETVGKIGESVLVSGWASTVRDHGSLIFVDLRDWSGTVQIVINQDNAEAFKEAEKAGLEYVIEVEGRVVERATEAQNTKIPTGKIEIVAEKFTILNKCKPLPFPLTDDGRDIDESLRMKYRFVDMRRKRVKELMKMRHDFLKFTTNWYSQNGFTQIQTPLLTVSSPEGARDFLVPSRVFPGKFYALPQAPQQYKQLLMVGGLHRYFQIAPCMRDEDPRADRHYGTFYQIDTEFSFVKQEEIFESTEPFFKEVIEKLTNKRLKYYPFLQIPYREALEKYGSDRPDVRFEMNLVELTKQFNQCEMNVFKTVPCVKAILVDRDFSKKEIDEWTEKAKVQGAKGLASIKVVDGKLDGMIIKYFSQQLQEEILGQFRANGYRIEGEQTIFAIAGDRAQTLKQMGWLRSQMGDVMNLKDPNEIAFAWIVDFDMFEWSETENRWDFMHNPFSMPKGGLEALRTQKPDEIKAQQYDLAGNGYELLSGSIRNFHPETFIEAFRICGYTEEETRSKFGHMISAFEFGAPPHGGYAIGMDRLMMVMFDEENIREIYAFPMSGAQELMTGSPREVSQKDLDILGIQLKDKGTEVLNKIIGKLESEKIQYKLLEHKEARTSEEAAEIRGTKLEDAAKTVVLHSLEYPSKYIMIVIPADKQADIEAVSKIIGEQVEVASAESVEAFSGLKVGAIPPFGRILGMEVFFDKAFWSKTESVFNAGRRDRSIIIATKDLLKVAEPNKLSIDATFCK